MKDPTRHHRRMRCHGGDMRDENISIVSRASHEGFHAAFQNMTSEQICHALNTIWGDYRYQFTCRRIK